MTPERFATYRTGAQRDFATDIVAAGMMPEPEALAKAAADFEALLPGGVDTPDHVLWTAMDGDQEVGILWLGFTEKSDGLHAFGYDFMVTEKDRRQGHGRAIMVAAEEVCRARGVVEIGLSVFGFNSGARSLYEQMGFGVTVQQMRKRL